MDPGDSRLDALREQATQAAGGMAQGEQALIAVLRDIEREKGRAADSYRAVVRSLAAALEARDGYTGGHSDEVHELAVAVARRLQLPAAVTDEISTVALLHDIGKIGIPDGILHKPARLDAGEWELMRQHPVIGERILRPLPGLSAVATAVRHEHERWDGDGYPDGLAGEEIPLASRVVLACDAWHALVSDRPYRRALPHETALAELRNGSGSQFDPAVVAALIDCIENPLPESDEPDVVVDDPIAAVLESGTGGEESRLQAELRALITVAAAVAAVHRLDDVIETAAEEARRALGAGSLSICKLDIEQRQLRVLINVGDLAPGEVRNPDNEVYPLDDYPRAKEMMEHGTAHLVDVADPDTDESDRELLLALGKVSAAAVPIVFADRVWGEIYATRNVGDPVFNDGALRFLQTISGQVAAAIGRAEMFTRVAELAYEDYLTGLANRRALDETLERACGEAVEHGHDLSLILYDVDDLKLINDQHGHGAGDAALVRVADALRSEVEGREGALVARISGDEFCIVLERTEAQDARTVAEAALGRLASDPVDPVTMSAGIASVGTGARRPADLMRAADAALYTAKRTGRRRVYVARSEDTRAAAAQPERRAELRARAAANLHRMLEDGIAQLDAGPATPLERLGAVMGVVADAIDASAWLVSHTNRGTRTIVTLHGVDSREARMSGVRFDTGMEEYDLDEYPATDSIQIAGGSFTVHVDDPEAEASERELLQGLGVASVVAVAVPGEHGCWLAELYGDERTLDPRAVEPYLRLLCGEAVRGAVAAPAPAIR